MVTMKYVSHDDSNVFSLQQPMDVFKIQVTKIL
jgi:hypothetical protein